VVATLGALAIGLYFAFPDKVGVPSMLNDRFALFVAFVAICMLPKVEGTRGAAALGIVAATAAFATANAHREFRAFEDEVGGFEQVLAKAPAGSRMMALIYERDSSIPGFTPYLHFGAYHRVRGGGVAEVSFAELPHSPLQYRRETAPPLSSPDREWLPDRFDNAREGAYYDYILVRGNADSLTGQSEGPRWTRIAQDGSWQMFAKVPWWHEVGATRVARSPASQ
jgi:hypothetical protein